jgi:organic radical activating enzyme
MPFVGFQNTHRGNRLCCVAKGLHKESVKEFWNSDYIKTVRDKMVKGEKLQECTKCYVDESQGKISLRNHYNALYKDSELQDTPTVMDLDFSNLCNLQCVMCGPDRSSQWAKELGDKTVLNISHDQIDELCEISSKIKHITIQGGEPSIMPEFERYFEYLYTNGIIGQIEVDCISNLTNTNNKFYELLGKFKTVNLNASIDAYGPANNYIRYPSNFSKIEQNLLSLSKKNLQVNLQISLQVLSMYSFYDFLVWVEKIQAAYKQNNKKLGLNLYFVTDPAHFDIAKAPKILKNKMVEDILQYKENFPKPKDVKFQLQLKNLLILLKEKNNPVQTSDQLISYIEQLDQRRNIKITSFIPDFYNYL